MSKHKTNGATKRSAKLTQIKVETLQTLAKSGMSLREISRQTGVNFSTVHKYAKQFSKQQSVMDFSVYSDGELGYIVGFFVGDGSQMNEEKSGHYGVKFALDHKRDSDITAFLMQLFEKGGKRVTLYPMGSWEQMKIYSKKLLLFFRDFVRYDSHSERSLKVLVDPSRWSKDFSLGFLGGLIDADGHVLEDKRNSSHFGAVITSANPLLVQQVAELLTRLGLKSKTATAKPSRTAFSTNTTYYIRLGKTDFSKVCRSLICININDLTAIQNAFRIGKSN
jgi:hypothetical protein